MNKYVKIPILIISIFLASLSFGQTQSIKIPIQGKTLNFSPNNGNYLNTGFLPAPEDYSDCYGCDFTNIYDGSSPLDVQQIVTNEYGELLFFIQDNQIFDYRGISSDEYQSPIYYFSDDLYGNLGDGRIRNLQVIPLDGDCYKFLIVFHVIDDGETSSSGKRNKLYYNYIGVNGDKSLSFFNPNDITEEVDGMEYPNEIFSFDHITEGDNPTGFAISDLTSSNERFLFTHRPDNTLATYKIGSQGIIYSGYNPQILYSHNLSGNNETDLFWEETELKKIGNNYYYVFADVGSHSAKIALHFVKIDNNGAVLSTIKKDVGYTWFDGEDVNEFIKGLEFSEDGDYLYFTQVGNSNLQYINTSFLFSNPIGTPPSIQEFISTSTDFQFSHIELARDGKMYLVNDLDGTLCSVSNTHNPSLGLSITNNIGGISDLVINSDYDLNPSVTNHLEMKNYALTKQVDGSDYTAYYTGVSDSCCSEHFYYADDYIIAPPAPNGTVETWTPTSNPFIDSGSSEVYLRDNLIIEANTDITILGMTFYFKEGKGIILNAGSGSTKGAKLTLDNSKCTAYDACNSNSVMWNGIELIGAGDAYDQYGSNTIQTQLIVKNNSTIEYAHEAVRAKFGAIVQASYSNFIDNEYGIYFDTYNNTSSSVSYVNHCSFTSDNLLYSAKGTQPNMFVFANSCSDILLKGNLMRNIADDSTIGGVYNRGHGIIATNTVVSIEPTKDSRGNIIQKSTFIKLRHAVIFEGTGSMGSSADNCIFDHNLDAFKIRGGADNCIVTRNEFKNIYNNDSGSTYESGGLYLEGVTGYTVEDNEFHDGVAGMFVLNSGIEYNQVYRNHFHNLTNNSNWTALIATEENGNYTPEFPNNYNGLDFICNKFENNDYAIAVIDGSVAKHQDGQDPNTGATNTGPTGNWFDHVNTMGLYEKTDFYTENAVVDMYTYTQHGNGTAPDQMKLDRDLSTHTDDYYDWNKILISQQYPSQVTYESYCPSNFSTGGGIGIGFESVGLTTIFQEAEDTQTEESIKMDELTDLKDASNSDDLTYKASTVSSDNFVDVSTEITEKSGYLKDTVLVSYIKSDVDMPVAKIVTLLSNSPLPAKAKKELATANLPQNYKDYLSNFQNGLYPREAKEKEISSLQSKYQFLTNRMLNIALKDTTGTKKDSLELWLSSQDNRFAKAKLLSLYMQQRKYTQAEVLLDEYKHDYAYLTDKQSEKAKRFAFVKFIELKLMKQPDSMWSIVNANIEQLEDLAQIDYGKENSLARYILRNAGYTEYVEKYPLPNSQNRSASISSTTFNSSTKQKASISVFPNPARNRAQVAFFSMSGSKNLRIYTLQGQLYKTIATEQTYGFVSIDVSSWASGMYIITSDDFNSSNTAKLNVQH